GVFGALTSSPWFRGSVEVCTSPVRLRTGALSVSAGPFLPARVSEVHQWSTSRRSAGLRHHGRRRKPMARPDKAAAVAEITERFRGSNAAVLTEYRGLSVKQVKTLRRSLGENAQYAVVKNTLTKIAANEAGISSLDDLFAGPTAVAFVTGDPVESAKALRD